jgi:hypothetical protein
MWTHVTSGLLGIWLMASPSLLDYGRPLASSDWIVGPLIASCGFIAAWEITRSVRWVNVVAAAWLALSPFVLGKLALDAVLANHVLSGVLVGVLSLVRGRQKHRFAGGWTSLGKAHTSSIP